VWCVWHNHNDMVWNTKKQPPSHIGRGPKNAIVDVGLLHDIDIISSGCYYIRNSASEFVLARVGTSRIYQRLMGKRMRYLKQSRLPLIRVESDSFV
jgi:hypothetical protein